MPKELDICRDEGKGKKGATKDKFAVCIGIKGILINVHSFAVPELA